MAYTTQFFLCLKFPEIFRYTARKLIRGDVMKRFFEGMLCGFLNGFFGSGGGVAAVPVLEYEQRGAGNTPAESVRRAHANSVAVIFVFSGGIDFGAAWGYIPWGAAGAVAGALFLRKIRAAWLQRIFGVLICAAAVRGLFS